MTRASAVVVVVVAEMMRKNSDLGKVRFLTMCCPCWQSSDSDFGFDCDSDSDYDYDSELGFDFFGFEEVEKAFGVVRTRWTSTRWNWI